MKKGIKNKIVNFFQEVRQETKKVNWPTKKEVIKYTLIVIGVSLVVAGFLGGLDFLLLLVLKKIVF